MNQPSSVKTSGWCVLIGGIWALLWNLTIAVSSLGLWIPAWLIGIPTGIVAIVSGVRLIGDKSYGRGGPSVSGVLLILQILNCDAFGMVLGIVALVMATRPEAKAWLLGQPLDTTPATGSGHMGAPSMGQAPPTGQVPPGPGVDLTTGFMPLAWLFYMCTPQVVVDHFPPVRRPWGRHYFPMPPGTHRLEVYFNYLGMPKHGQASIDVEVPPNCVVHLEYYKSPLIWSPGTLKVLNVSPLPGPPLRGGHDHQPVFPAPASSEPASGGVAPPPPLPPPNVAGPTPGTGTASPEPQSREASIFDEPSSSDWESTGPPSGGGGTLEPPVSTTDFKPAPRPGETVRLDAPVFSGTTETNDDS